MASDNERKVSRGVGSIDNGGRILRAFVDHGQPLKLSVLAELTGMQAGRLHPYLVSLRKIGLVEQTPEGNYQLGTFALELGLVRLRHLQPVREAVSRVAGLSEQLNMMVSIAVWAPHGPTIVHIHEHSDILHFNIRIGGVYYMTMTATGLVFASFLPEFMTETLIEKELTSQELRGRRDWFDMDRGSFERRRSDVKRTGYAITVDMPVPGITAVSAPVYDHTGHVQMCIAVIGSKQLVDVGPSGEPVPTLQSFAKNLSRDLGHMT